MIPLRYDSGQAERPAWDQTWAGADQQSFPKSHRIEVGRVATYPDIGTVT